MVTDQKTPPPHPENPNFFSHHWPFTQYIGFMWPWLRGVSIADLTLQSGKW